MWGSAALQVLLAPAPTTETRSPALKCSKSVAVYHLDFQILRFHTASAGSSYSWHNKLRPLNGCFAVRSGSSNLRVGYSCLRPEAALSAFRQSE
jgi:hypothetical protein